VATSNSRGRRRRRALAAALALALVYGVWTWIAWTAPARAVQALSVPPVAADVDAFVADKRADAARRGTRPTFVERLVRRAPGRTRVALLYLHGFGASRAEGEAVVDPLADELGANVYYARLPGHGESVEAHAAQRFEDYVVVAEQSLVVARALGERVVVIGTSTGGLLGTWLASRHPDEVAALILASPLYAYSRSDAFVLSCPGGIALARLLNGPDRDAKWIDDPEHRKLEGYEAHWMEEQRFDALYALDDVRRLVVGGRVLEGVRSPVLLMHTTQERDGAVSVAAMARAFARMNGGTPARGSRVVQVDDGSHVLMSAYVRSDKARVGAEVRAFLRDVGLM